jgi:hypothetical protein
MLNEAASSASMLMHRTIARAEGWHSAAMSSIASFESRVAMGEAAKGLRAMTSSPDGVRVCGRHAPTHLSRKTHSDGVRGEFRVDPALILTLGAAERGMIGHG